MRQIKNGFKDYYFLTEDGQIYNAKSQTYLKPGISSHKLQTEDNRRRQISLASLYELVYERPFIQDDIERLEGEIFREIPGSEGKYLISNYGRCISYNQGSSAKLLTPINNKTGGYLRVAIKINGSFKKKLIHQLVAERFCEKPEGSSLQIHHIDFNHSNNRSDNLEYLSPGEHLAKHLEREKLLLQERSGGDLPEGKLP